MTAPPKENISTVPRVSHGLALDRISIENLLSFGQGPTVLDLESLNVLIGPNGSGKSNLIEILGLLHSLPKDFTEPIREGGGIHEWLWKGLSESATATIEILTTPLNKRERIRYRLSFTRLGYQLDVTDERIENEKPVGDRERPYLYFGYENGRPMFNIGGQRRFLAREEVNPQQSVLSQRKDPDQYPELTYLGNLFASFRLYRDWEFGINARAREACSADSPSEYLEEDATNLPVVLNRLQSEPRVKSRLREYLRMFSEDAVDLNITIREGRVELRLEQNNGFTIPAMRLSDGTLRWISLLTVLLHPSPPRLVCIEEPELGLHPDMIKTLAELLRSASERMQLIVTTHSDALVEHFTETPEMIVVCEKTEGVTTLKRLHREGLRHWLESYSLGELWRKGQIGGNRF